MRVLTVWLFAACKNVLPEFDTIKEVAVARRNMQLTQDLLEQFQSIPAQANKLLGMLNGEDGERNVKEVYLALQFLLRMRRKARIQGVKYSEEVRNQVNSQFRCLQGVCRRLEVQVWDNIEGCLALVGNDEDRLSQSRESVW